jgi:flagellar biosynthesis protein FlhG
MRVPAHAALKLPQDQADGLRRMFAGQRTRYVALVNNPHVANGGVVIDGLVAAYGQRGLHTLVVDAAPTASEPHELALIDMPACVERLAQHVSFLAARGLPMRFVDARGSSAGFLDALADAAPQAQVILVHAAASDLCRLFMRRTLRPLLLADTGPESVTHAYAAMKFLAQRLGLLAYDLIVAASPASERVARVAECIAGCGDRFLGAALHDWIALDPASDANAPVPDELVQLATALLVADNATTSTHAPLAVGPASAGAAASWGRAC